MKSSPRITLLAGGVGGAKAALGLYLSEHKANLSVIGNIAGDEEFHGLWVSPDIDNLTYTLAGRINQQQGWGLEGLGLAQGWLGTRKWAQHGPNLSQVGANLGSTWAQLKPTWSQLGLKLGPDWLQ